MADQIDIRIIFTKKQNGYEPTDALYYPLNEYPNITQEEIENTKQERMDNWIELVNTPPVEVSLEEQLAENQQLYDDLESQQSLLIQQANEIQAAIRARDIKLK